MIKKTLLVFSAVILAACAANRGPEELRPQVTEDWIEVDALSGAKYGKVDKATGIPERQQYLFKVTMVRTSSNGGFGFMGLQNDVKLGYFNFTETNLQFKSVEGVYQGNESPNVVNPVIVQWPATYHDVRLDVVEGRVTNKQIDDDFKSWDQKKYIKPNFNEPSIGEEQTLPYTPALATTLQCWTLASRERVRESMQLESDGYFSFMVEAVYKQNPLCSQSQAKHHDADFTYTVHYRYSFRPYEPSTDYTIFEFKEGELDDARYGKYGYFQTVKPEADPKRPGGRKNRFFANRWNPNKKHTFYFADGTPEHYKPLFKDIFAQTNELLAKTGNAIRFEVLDYNHDGIERQFGDLRYSFINIVDELDPSSPLGYGPSDADPLTGEIIAANTMIWTGSLEYYMERLEMIAKREKGKFENESLFQKMTQALEMEPSTWQTAWNLSDNGIGRAYKQVVADTTFNVGYNAYTTHEGFSDVSAVMMSPSKPSEGVFNSANRLASFTEVLNLPDQMDEAMKQKMAQNFVSGQMQNALGKGNPFDTESGHALAGLLQKRFSPINLDNIAKTVRDHVHNHEQEIEMNERGHCIYPMEAALEGAHKLFLEGSTREQIIENVVYRTGIHEFGHNLNLRHNFYGTVDNSNFRLHETPETLKYLEPVHASVNVEDINPKRFVQVGGKLYWAQNSSSVMDYLRLEHESHTPRTWEDYDRAALFYAYSGGKELHPERSYLFCTDEHTATSALCNRFDMGTTPSEVLLSIIEAYDSSYVLNNYRNGRSFWNTLGYAGRVAGTMSSIKEFYAMWRSAFAQDIVINSLAKLGINDKKEIDETYEMLTREMKKTTMLSMAFYQSVIQQSAVDKPYRSVYDEKTGALMRMGIGMDKIFAMLYLAGDFTMPYHPNRYMIHQSYLTHTFDSGMARFMHRIWENVNTVRVDMEQGFISFGRMLYAQSAKNFFNRDTEDFIQKIFVESYPFHSDLVNELGVELPADFNARLVTVQSDKNPSFQKGEEVAVIHFDKKFYVISKSRSPYAYTVANGVISNMNEGFSTVQDKLDLEELLMLSNR